MKYVKKLMRKVQYALRDFFINKKNRKRLKNRDFSIIFSDCTGGCICHDLKMQLNSPTVNFFFPASDYVKYLKRLPEYLRDYTIEEIAGERYLDRPVAKIVLPDGEYVKAYLLHYETVADFCEKYEKRAKRVNKENLFFIFNDRNGFSEDDLREFDRLPYENKVCFVHKEIAGINNQYVIPGTEKKEEVEPMMNYIRQLCLKRFYDYFDFVSWLNGEK